MFSVVGLGSSLVGAFTFITHPHYICAMSIADLMLYFAMSDKQN